MFIRELELRNIKCFKNEKLTFVDENGNMIKWTVILGENGTGKSVILRTIALLLSGYEVARELQKEPRRMVRFRETEAIATATLDLSDTKKSGSKIVKTGLQFLDQPFWKGMKSVPYEKTLDFYDYAWGSLLCGYGATRITRDKRFGKKFYMSKDSNPRVQCLETLFSEETYLEPLDDWLKTLEYESLRKQKRKTDLNEVSRFDSAVRVLKRLLPSVKFKEINNEGEAIFTTPYGEAPLSELSRGYRDVLTWVSDLMRRLIENYPKSRNPLRESGVVLVEEIALHLHPVWQKKVISFLKHRFPNIQFIVTTHSPLTAQSLERNEFVILKRQLQRGKLNDSVSITRIDVSPKSLTANQILTSPLFGLSSARSIDVQNKRNEFYKLKKKMVEGEVTEKDEKEYKKLLKFFGDNTQAPGITYDQRDLFLKMEGVLKKLGRDDLLEYPSEEVLKRKRQTRQD